MAVSKIGTYDPSQALSRTLGMLEESCRRAIEYHLKQRYDIDRMSSPTLPQIEEAIRDMFGEGSSLLLTRLRTELRQTDD